MSQDLKESIDNDLLIPDEKEFEFKDLKFKAKPYSFQLTKNSAQLMARMNNFANEYCEISEMNKKKYSSNPDSEEYQFWLDKYSQDMVNGIILFCYDNTKNIKQIIQLFTDCEIENINFKDFDNDIDSFKELVSICVSIIINFFSISQKAKK